MNYEAPRNVICHQIPVILSARVTSWDGEHVAQHQFESLWYWFETRIFFRTKRFLHFRLQAETKERLKVINMTISAPSFVVCSLENGAQLTIQSAHVLVLLFHIHNLKMILMKRFQPSHEVLVSHKMLLMPSAKKCALDLFLSCIMFKRKRKWF